MADVVSPSDMKAAEIQQPSTPSDNGQTEHTTPLEDTTNNAIETLRLTIQHHGKPLDLILAATATISDLSDHISTHLSIPASHQKFLIPPKPGLIKPPFKPEHATLPISTLIGRKVTLLGSTPAEISTLNQTIKTAHAQASSSRHRHHTGPVKPAAPARNTDWQRRQDDSTYTFLQLRPLPYLPNPERSLRFLERLRDDAGIRAAMRRHKYSVPLLTEMNPIEHTTENSRTLGLNRNRGEVIELRLRTDAYDGYRDYKTIRRTLCHELAHNVFGEHDADFWNLCHQIEREVERDDWRSGGRAVGSQEYYEGAGEEDEIADHAGWEGGEFVLGGGGSSSGVRSLESSLGESGNGAGLSRREILARAAEERMKKKQQQQSQHQDSNEDATSG